MIYMLDTNILIYLIKNKPPGIADRINALDTRDELTMSFLTYAELLKGAERSTRKNQVLAQLQQLTRSIPVDYSVNADLCQHYATQFTLLKTAGPPSAPMTFGLLAMPWPKTLPWSRTISGNLSVSKV